MRPNPIASPSERPVPAHPAPPEATGASEERDPAFLARLVALDREALGRFYELYFGRVWAYVRQLVGDEVLAEDVTQEVFLHLQRAFPTYDRSRALAPWVLTIATNKVRDLWRSRRQQFERGVASLDEADDGPALDVSDPRPGPLPDLEARELRAALATAVDELPAGLRAAFVLRWHERLEFDAIGHILGRNEGAARKRYSRALAELRRSLESAARARRGQR